MDCGRDRLQVGCDSAQMLRVADYEQSRWGKMTHDTANHFFFGLLVEVDQDISTKNEIEGIHNGIGIGVEIDPGESYDPVQFGISLHDGFVLAPPSEHV